jgi:hypothetical protein
MLVAGCSPALAPGASVETTMDKISHIARFLLKRIGFDTLATQPIYFELRG